MAYTIKCGYFSKRQNSTKQPDTTGWEELEVTLKGGTSIENPTLTLKHEFFTYNYVVFRDRYYFVDDIIALRNDLYEVSLSLDILATYKDEILATTQFVSYSSVSGGAWLADTRIPVLKSTVVGSASTALPFFLSGGWYILSCIGKVGSCLYALSLNNLKALIASISGGTDDFEQAAINRVDNYFGGQAPATAEEALYALAQVTTQNDILGKAYGNAPSCLRSCLYVPFVVNSQGGETIWLGNYNTGVTGVVISAAPVTGSVSVSIPWHFSDWRRGYCEQVYLYLPLVGMVSVSSDNLTHTDSITINYSYTSTDGTVAYQVIAGGEIIGSYGGSCAINYPLGVNQQASAGQVTQAIMQGVAQTVSAGITGNVVGAVAGIAATAYNALDTALTSHPSCVGGIGGGAGSGLSHSVTCYTVAHDTVIDPADMAATMGVPTMKPLALSSCSGYCQCANAHVALSAPVPEINAVDAWLNSGFYIE